VCYGRGTAGRAGALQYAPGAVLLSIPSPSDPYAFHVGPVQPRWFGIVLAVAVVVAAWVTRRELRRRDLDPELVLPVGVAAVVLGLVGARVEHVVTDWTPFGRDPNNMFWLWRGGLGMYGALAGGMLGAFAACRWLRVPFWVFADCAAPGLVLGQAIGRWGDYLNQELYGRASDLPWAVRIDHPLPPYIPGQSFQPAFLYESLWDLAVFAVLVVFVRRVGGRVAPGAVFALYLALYSLGRLWIGLVRIDPSDHLLGQRVDVWVAALVAAVAAAAFARLWTRRHATG
jgi:phosphatidylglycerol---prolipoprotein diacylglyceryl transferase